MKFRALPVLLISFIPQAVAQEKPKVRTTFPSAAVAATAYGLPGRTEPIQTATIFSRATGIVSERKFDIGDRVKEGEILAIIAAPDLDRQTEAALARLEQSATRSKNLRNLSQRTAALLNTRAVSDEEAEQRLSDAEEADAAVRVATAELARLRELQKFAQVTAPFEGIISARNFDRGDRMRGDSSTAEGWLYKLVRLDEMRFIINASPDLALRLTQQTEATVRFTELPGRSFTGKVTRSSRVFETTTGTMRTEILLANQDLALPAGLTGTAIFNLTPAPDTFILPNNTLIVRQGKNLVTTVKDGKVTFIEVLPGKNSGPTLEVTSASLSADTPVIINPNAMLREGDPVEIAKPPSPAKNPP